MSATLSILKSKPLGGNRVNLKPMRWAGDPPSLSWCIQARDVCWPNLPGKYFFLSRQVIIMVSTPALYNNS